MVSLLPRLYQLEYLSQASSEGLITRGVAEYGVIQGGWFVIVAFWARYGEQNGKYDVTREC